MRQWKHLTDREKQRIVDVSLRNNIRDIGSIILEYNTYALGGDSDGEPLYGQPEEPVKRIGSKKVAKKYVDRGGTGVNIHSDEYRKWLENWYLNRPEQLYNNYVDNNILDKLGESLGINTKEELIDKAYDNLFSSIDEYSEVSPNGKYLRSELTPSERKVLDYVAENQLGEDLSDFPAWRVSQLLDEEAKAHGYTEYPHSFLFSETLRPGTIVHERTHMLHEFPQELYIRNEIEPQKHLKSRYSQLFDDPAEIYARLMQFRYLNGINPKHTMTKEDLKTLRSNPNTWNNLLLDRYTDEDLLRMFNEVAYTPQNNEQVNYAAYGGNLFNLSNVNK